MPIQRGLYTTHMHQITRRTMKDDHMQLSKATLVGVNRTYMHNIVEINLEVGCILLVDFET